MNINQARRLLEKDVSKMSPEELRKHKVKLIDAMYMARGDYGYNNDFFVYVGEVRAYTPKDYWLLKNINNRLDEIEKELKKRCCQF